MVDQCLEQTQAVKKAHIVTLGVLHEQQKEPIKITVIASRIGYSRIHTLRILGDLEESGWLTVHRGTYPHTYEVTSDGQLYLHLVERAKKTRTHEQLPIARVVAGSKRAE